MVNGLLSSCRRTRPPRRLEQTCQEIPRDIVDEIVLVDDASTDNTAAIARSLNLQTYVHRENLGYGANQKTCYTEALRLNADIVVMLHPDYQYDPRLVTPMAAMIASGVYDVVLASRILAEQRFKAECLSTNTSLTACLPRFRIFWSRQVVGIPFGLPGILRRGAAKTPAAGEFRRLRVRQSNDRTDLGV